MGKRAQPGEIPQFGAHKSFTVHLIIPLERGVNAQVCGLIKEVQEVASVPKGQKLEAVRPQVRATHSKQLVHVLEESVWPKLLEIGQCSIQNFSYCEESLVNSDIKSDRSCEIVDLPSAVLYLDIDSNILWFLD